MIRLTPEQAAEVTRHPDGVECQIEETGQVYILLDAELLRRMKQALYDKEVNASIAEGIRQMEAGEGMTVAESRAAVRQACGFPDPQES